MKARITRLCLLSLFIIFYRPSPASAQSTAFLYQGRLQSQGSPANGSYDLIFTLYATNTDGAPVAGPVTNNATSVTNGLFTVSVDFGPGVFGGSNYWLDLQVSTNAANAFTELTPRQAIMPVPYALYAPSAGTVAATNLTGPITTAQLPASVVTNGASNVNFTGTFTGNGSGLTNLPSSGSGFTWQIVAGMIQQAATNSGYIVTNGNSRVTITLPATVNVGDIVRVSGLGAGGWQIAQNNGQSIVAGNLAGSSSLAGIFWTPRSEVRNWTAVASSADGTKLAAAGNGTVYTSLDSGLTWMPQNVVISNANSQLFGTPMASSADGSKLFVLASPGQGACRIYISADSGLNWTNLPVIDEETSLVLADPTCIACSADGSKLITADFDGQSGFGGNVFMSQDSGFTWTVVTNLANNVFSTPFTGVASSADGSKLVLAGAGGGFPGIYTSTDSGVTWTLRTNSTATYMSVASSADGSKLAVALDGDLIYTSTDSGATWTGQTNGIPNNGQQHWWSIEMSADGTKLLASIGDDPNSGLPASSGPVYISTNSGVSWAPHGTSLNGVSVAGSADGSKLALAAYGDHLYTTGPSPVPATTTGTAGSLTGGQNTAVELQYIGNGQWLPISHEGNIFAN